MRKSNYPGSMSARLLLVVWIGAFLAPAALAQENVGSAEIREIDRRADTLRDRIEQPPDPDRDVADTAVVLTSLTYNRAVATCAAFDGNGALIGRARVRIPRMGLRWLLASDISNDVDFIGSAHCFVAGKVAVTAVFLGPGITDLPVQPEVVDGMYRIAIPLVAHY
jgi:hypothetical protein